MQIVLDWSVLVPKARWKQGQEGFGPRLTRLRQARELAQEELGALRGLSNRMVAYYEREDAQAPSELLAGFARALKTSTDELLGVRPVRETTRPTARLLKRLKKVEDLSPVDRRAVLKVVDALHEARRRNGCE